jgi:hypothetical protein
MAIPDHHLLLFFFSVTSCIPLVQPSASNSDYLSLIDAHLSNGAINGIARNGGGDSFMGGIVKKKRGKEGNVTKKGKMESRYASKLLLCKSLGNKVKFG